MADISPAVACTTTRPKDLLMVALSRFFAVHDNIERVISSITCKSGVSLRLIDWFVTTYAKRHDILIRNAATSSHFNVYLSYRAQLKAYSKQLFDPFRRRDRIIFAYDENKSVETTIGQLNFFRWMIQNGVLDYVLANADDIERIMLQETACHQPKPPQLDASMRKGAPACPTSLRLGAKAAARSSAAACQQAVHSNPTAPDALKIGRKMTRITGTRTLLFD